MNSRAKIGALAKTDPALLVPYGGEQRAIGELQALGVALTPEDYRAIRESFGGGKKGRARARELVPLECPACEARLTHFDRSGREPYFAASAESTSHGPHCYAVDAISGGTRVVDAAAEEQTVTAKTDEPSAQVDEPLLAQGVDVVVDSPLARPRARFDEPRAPQAHIAEALRAEADDAEADDAEELVSEELVSEELVSEELVSEELVSEASVDAELATLAADDDDDEAEERVTEELVPEDLVPEALVAGEAYYFIAGGPELSAKAELKSRLGLVSEVVPDTAPPGAVPADARELLIQALNRTLPARTTINFRGRDHAVVAAGDVHTHSDGTPLAVYGRFTEAEWHAASGRLVLKATTRSVQVWATSVVPRRLFQVESNREITTPVLGKPVPFLAFGTLKKLGPTCGIPVFRGDSLVLLQALSLPARESRDTWVDAPGKQDGLTLLPTPSDVGLPASEQPASEPVRGGHDVAAVARTLPPAPSTSASTGAAWTTFDHAPDAGAAARDDGLSLLVPAAAVSAAPSAELRAAAETGETGLSTVAPVAPPPPARGALSTFRSLASSFRRSKSRGG